MRRYWVGSATLALGGCAVMNTLAGCGDDDDGTAADRVGIAAECTADAECPEVRRSSLYDTVQLTCLQGFRGGYCGISGCEEDARCPDGSACVNHEGRGYCFRLCADKAECNRNRSLENEANCSANVEFRDTNTGSKACVPPSSGL